MQCLVLSIRAPLSLLTGLGKLFSSKRWEVKVGSHHLGQPGGDGHRTCCLAGGSGSFTPDGRKDICSSDSTPPCPTISSEGCPVQENRARAWTDAPTASLLAYKSHQVALKTTGIPVFLQLQCQPEEHHVPQKATGQCQQWGQTQWGEGARLNSLC